VPLYQELGLSLELPLGMEFRELSSLQRQDAGRQVLVVTGEIANVSGQQRELPPIRVALLDADRQELDFGLFDPPQPVGAVMSEVPDGPPMRFTWRGKTYGIARWEGPEFEHRPEPKTAEGFIPTVRERVKPTDLDAHGDLSLAAYVHRFTAGIQPIDGEPAYRRFRVRPRPGGGLTWAEGALDCPYGRIESSWRLAGDELQLRVLVPAGTQAQVVLPDGRLLVAGPGRHEFTARLADDLVTVGR